MYEAKSPLVYLPLDTPAAVADDLFIVDGPAVRMAFPLGIEVPFSTRMTVARLQNGDLFLHSPTRLVPALKTAIDALGRVAHLVSPNFLHYASIPEWAEAYPDAVTWASPGVRERARKQGIAVRFDRDLGASPDAAWAGEIDQLFFEGSFALREAVFFHRASRTLIVTDLIENFEAARLPARVRWFARFGGVVDPDGRTPLDLRLSFLGRRDAARRCLDRMRAWDPERIIMSHGRWYDRDGRAELERAFRWLA